MVAVGLFEVYNDSTGISEIYSIVEAINAWRDSLLCHAGPLGRF
jgi:hypothetical protein